MKKLFSTLLFACFIFATSFSQVILYGPDTFDYNPLYSSYNPPPHLWHAPSSNPPFLHFNDGGCDDGRIGYAANWNSYWSNFARMPILDCSNHDTILLTFDVSHSYFPEQTEDKCYFSMWADESYKKDFINSITIDGVDISYGDLNGKGFKFSEKRECQKVEIEMDLGNVNNKSGIYLYFNASCSKNNSNLFEFYIDNVTVYGYSGSTVNIENNTNYIPITITPSLVENTLNINNLPKEISAYNINIYNLNGQIVHKTTVTQNEHVSINVEDLSKGLYFIELYDNNLQYHINTKVIKL